MSADSLKLSAATTPEEIVAALAVREDMYSDYLGLSPRTWPDEDLRDQDGHLFILRHEGEVVASGRVLPISSPHVELRAFRKLPPWAEQDPKMCEISRIAARPRSQGVPYGWIGLILGAEWLLQHTDIRRYIAYARAELVSLYRVVGAWETDMRFQIPERGPAVYSVVTGTIQQAAEKGTSLLAEAAERAEEAASETPSITVHEGG
jgi:hypothetical protein